MIFAEALKFPTGVPIVTTWSGDGSAHVFDLRDFVQLPEVATITTFVAIWAFGDGGTATVTDPANPVASHAFRLPARYTLQLQLTVNDQVTHYRWNLDVGLDRNAFQGGARPVFDFVSAVHGTFALSSGPRHAIQVLPRATQFRYGSYGSYDPGALGPPVNPVAFNQAVPNLTAKLQEMAVRGFGRMPPPAQPLPRAVHLHTDQEAMILGAADAVDRGFALLHDDLRRLEEEATNHPGMLSIFADDAADVGQIIARSIDCLELGELAPMSGGQVVLAGKNSIAFGPVLEWRDYELNSVPDATTMGGITAKDWRKLQRSGEFPVPEVDWDFAWTWVVLQAFVQGVGGFYREIGKATYASLAGIVTCSPATGVCSFRFHDTALGLWVHVTVGPVASGATRLSATDQLFDGTLSRGYAPGPFVAARGAGMLFEDAAGPRIPRTYDIEYLEDFFAGHLDAEWPAKPRDAAPLTLSRFSESYSSAREVAVAPDGSERRSYALAEAGTYVAAVLVDAKTVPLPAPDWRQELLVPHAMAAVRLGLRGYGQGSGQGSGQSSGR